MKKKTILLAIITELLIFFLAGCSTPEIDTIVREMSISLLEVSIFVVLLIALLFLMNKSILNSEGQTHRLACSIIGVIIFPGLFLAGFGLKFGLNWITVPLAVIPGGIIGWYSYTLDEMILGLWENRKVTIPGIIGLVMGGMMLVTTLNHVWLEGDMFVTHKACAARVVIERYTEHINEDSDGEKSSSYDWEYLYHIDRMSFGTTPPVLIEDRDYQLGRGALFIKNRVRQEIYYFVGGIFFSEKRNSWNDHLTWLRLANPSLNFAIDKVQRIQSNFYGHPIKNVGEVNRALPKPPEKVDLPGTNELPQATQGGKILGMFIDFFQMLFTEKEYSELLFVFIVLATALILVAVFLPNYRQSIIAFLYGATIIGFVIAIIVASRCGRLTRQCYCSIG